MVKYKMTRVPLDVWEAWFGKKKKIEERIQVKTKKKINVPLSDVLRFYGKQERFEWDDIVVPYFTRKRKRGRNSSMQII